MSLPHGHISSHNILVVDIQIGEIHEAHRLLVGAMVAVALEVHAVVENHSPELDVDARVLVQVLDLAGVFVNRDEGFVEAPVQLGLENAHQVIRVEVSNRAQQLLVGEDEPVFCLKSASRVGIRNH